MSEQVNNQDLELNNQLPPEESLYDSVKILSPSRMVLRRFFRSPLSMLGLGMLIFLFLFSFFGPMLTNKTQTQTFPIPRDVTITNNEKFIAEDGQTYNYIIRSTATLNNNALPSKDHWLGTDANQMDVLVRLMVGGRISLTISFLVVFLETIIGVVLGGISGYFGKWVDTLIMRIVDIFICLPGMPILLISSQIIVANGVAPKYRIYWLMGILTIFGWAGTARMVRGQILSLREQEFMTAAEATGIRPFSKIFKHLIPNVMPQLIVAMTLGLGSIILYEATLSYLGLGVPYPEAAWGSMISAADPTKGADVLQYYPNQWVFPGLLIVMAVLGFNFVGDGLRDAFDPKMKR